MYDDFISLPARFGREPQQHSSHTFLTFIAVVHRTRRSEYSQQTVDWAVNTNHLYCAL